MASARGPTAPRSRRSSERLLVVTASSPRSTSGEEPAASWRVEASVLTTRRALATVDGEVALYAPIPADGPDLARSLAARGVHVAGLRRVGEPSARFGAAVELWAADAVELTPEAHELGWLEPGELERDDGAWALAPGVGVLPGELGERVAPGVVRLPLATPTLPPATHTNAVFVGDERFVVVDPATYDPGERALLDRAIEARVRLGDRLEAVVLTHHHGDHVGAAAHLAERGAPLWAHAETARRLGARCDRALSDADTIELGRGRLEVLHTPGHAPGHLTLSYRRGGRRTLIVGDMVASVGSILIDPDEGDMAEYLRQLERLARLDPAVLVPAHGPAIAPGRAKLEAYVAHRLDREAKVLAALHAAAAPATPEDLLPSAYADTPSFAWPLAARACRAHLDKLSREGLATALAEGRFAAASRRD